MNSHLGGLFAPCATFPMCLLVRERHTIDIAEEFHGPVERLQELHDQAARFTKHHKDSMDMHRELWEYTQQLRELMSIWRACEGFSNLVYSHQALPLTTSSCASSLVCTSLCSRPIGGRHPPSRFSSLKSEPKF